MTTTPTRQLQTGPAVWRSGDLSPDEGVVVLTAAQRDAIVAATLDARARGITLATVDRQQFPLPAMANELASWVGALADGRGFLLLRDFPIDQLDQLDEQAIELAYAGLGTHFGRPVGQNKDAELLTHVRDERLPPSAGKVRLYRTRERQDFHTDGADVIGLLCLHTALRGGESRIVSAGAIYNELLRTRPDLLEALHTTMAWDRQGDVPEGELPYFMLAPINDLGGTPRVLYLGWYIRDAQMHPEVPRLTDAQLEAMTLLEQLANDPTFHLEMDFRPGDVQLLNNGRILHAREAYDDADDPAARRHLLRLWLAAHDFASVEAGLRGGVA